MQEAIESSAGTSAVRPSRPRPFLVGCLAGFLAATALGGAATAYVSAQRDENVLVSVVLRLLKDGKINRTAREVSVLLHDARAFPEQTGDVGADLIARGMVPDAYLHGGVLVTPWRTPLALQRERAGADAVATVGLSDLPVQACRDLVVSFLHGRPGVGPTTDLRLSAVNGTQPAAMSCRKTGNALTLELAARG